MKIVSVSGWRPVSKALAALLVVLICAGGAWYGGNSRPQGDDAAKLRALNQKYQEFAAEDFPAVATVDPQEVLGLRPGKDVVFVDVREPEEQAVSMLPGAVPAQKVLCCPDKWQEKRLVAYCTVSYRSGVMAKQAAEKGLRVENLRGGILGWLHAGGKVYDPQGKETDQVHVWSRSWDYSPERYKAVW